MAPRNTNSEAALILAVFVLGLLLRLTAVDRLAVEHFDEGIYVSNLWYDEVAGGPYPGRHLYAPPLLGSLIAAFDWLPGMRWLAPFLPGILLGAMTIPVVWWLARSWFGRSAGLFAGIIVAMSDFHILSSRTALTDVPVLFFICLAVGWGISGIHARSWRRMVIAGIFCGSAWWTKYTGWLPLAIVSSGGGLWWLWRGRLELSFRQLAVLVATMTLTAFLIWLPWLLALQEVGGYAAVAANHRGYLGDFSVWKERLTLQLSCQFYLDGLTGSLSVGLGMLVASSHRWIQARCSTWNSQSGDMTSVDSTATFPPPRLLVRFAAAGIALSIISFTIWTPLLLTCLAIGGLCGIFLWPVLQRAFSRSQSGDLSPACDGGRGFSIGDLACAPRIDPALGLCTITVWLLGMLATTPLYHPYPRLFLPLLAAIWIASSAGVGWWIESNLSVARRPVAVQPAATVQRLATRLIVAMVLFAVAVSILLNDSVFSSSIFLDRTSLRNAAAEIAVLCAQNARPAVASQKSHLMAMPTGTTAATVDEVQRTRMVIYAYGEPALLFQLHELGAVVRPVSHLNFSVPAVTNSRVPEYLIFGPYAKRTPDFWSELLPRQDDFEFLGDVYFRPSPVVLLDLFGPAWIRGHEDAAEQRIEVYRIRPARPSAAEIDRMTKD